MHLDLDNLESALALKPIALVHFWSVGSPGGDGFELIYDRSARRHPAVLHADVNTDQQQHLAQIAGVADVPTTLVFRDGVLIYREPGALSARVLEELIQQIKLVDMDKLRAATAVRDPSSTPRPWT
ncbi:MULTISPECIES: thioredoxin family protein [Mycolicibacterium]|nr:MULTISPECIES: thioredoxin family protein [Mycolicibacterium]MCV7003104.1 thioredoxin family protein [Mycolicibacterium alvei]MCV7107801.1 thioredoxin family protein [Mycolicibacterium chitae]